jgi:oxygen-dependent protoporphyrinogen oxidase
MPRFSVLEAEHRSVTLGLLRNARGAQTGTVSGVRYGLFVSFDGGVQTLTDALAHRLGSRLELGKKVQRIEKADDGYTLHLDGETRQTDGLIIATPARPMARMVRSLDVELAESLLDIPYGSSAAVYYCFDRKDVPHALDAFGFVVPKEERRRIIASTWASVKFAGRAPGDKALLRAFFGGDGNDEMLDLDDDSLVDAGRSEFAALLGIRAEPRFTHVSRHPHAMPKYLVGHTGRVTRIERHMKRHPKLELAGNSMYGVGIPDAVRSGQAAADRMVTALNW